MSDNPIWDLRLKPMQELGFIGDITQCVWRLEVTVVSNYCRNRYLWRMPITKLDTRYEYMRYEGQNKKMNRGTEGKREGGKEGT